MNKYVINGVDYKILNEYILNKTNYNIDEFLYSKNIIVNNKSSFKNLPIQKQFDIIDTLYRGYDYKIINLIAKLYNYNIDNKEFVKLFISNWLYITYITAHNKLLRYIKYPSYELCEWLLIRNINYYKYITIPSNDYELQKQVKELYKFLTL
jgi:hypothetical protein